MAKRGDPEVLRLVVKTLRDWSRMTQARFGKESRVAQPVLSIYESGKRAPSEAVLRRMGTVARLEWPQVMRLCNFFSSFVADARSASVPARGLEVNLPGPGLLTVPHDRKAQPWEPAPPSPEAELAEAETLWASLEKHPLPFRRRLIEISPRAGSWALAVKACEASVKAAKHSAEEALELAELALSIAARIPGENPWRSRVEGYVWAHLANARRVANDLDGAEAAFARAWEIWPPERDSRAEIFAAWVLPSMEASLRRAQRRFSEALSLIEKARRSRGGDTPVATIFLLLQKEHILEQIGDTSQAITVLEEAAPWIEALGDARLHFSLRFNLADNLCQLQRYEEATVWLPEVRELAAQQGNALDLLRVGWLEAKVAAGQGRAEEAIAGLEQVGRAFTDREMPYDAALASLDLAVLLLEAGRTMEVKELAVTLGRIFNAKGISREALASLKLFCDAAREEAATVELARKVMADVEQARRSVPPS